MRTLLAIKSCWPNKERRNACRQTWLQDPNLLEWADYWFLAGEHAPLKYYADKCEILNGENDVKAFHVKDDFKNIAPKIQKIMWFALTNGYTTVAVVDDDTYVVPERLRAICESADAVDYIGFKRTHESRTLFPDYMQGSCYIVGQQVLARLAMDDQQKLVDGVPDDVAVGRSLGFSGGVIYKHNDLFWPGPTPAAIHKNNHLVSTHKCSPNRKPVREIVSMYDVHKAWVDSNA